MKKLVSFISALLLICNVLFGNQIISTEKKEKFVKNEFILKLREKVKDDVQSLNAASPSLKSLNNRYKVKFSESIGSKKTLGKQDVKLIQGTTLLIQFDDTSDVLSVIREYKKLKIVEFAEPNYIVTHNEDAKANYIPGDELFQHQWGLKNTGNAITYNGNMVGNPGEDINAVPAWDVSLGSSDVIVSIIDEGVDLSHPEFAGRLVPGYDCVNEDNDPNPLPADGHGTACAGIVAAANDGIGVIGVAPGVKIMPVKSMQDGSGSYADIIQGIIFSTDNGAHVISMSLGGTGYSYAMEEAVNYAVNNGVIVLAAAGNSNTNNLVTPHYPASYANCISVGAMSPCGLRKTPSTCDGEYWWGSNYGDLDFITPGTRIYTTDITGSGGYNPTGNYVAAFNGTSAATPFAAGVAALALSVLPNLTPIELRESMQLTSVDVGDEGYDLETGFGRLDAFALLAIDDGIAPDPITDVEVTDIGVISVSLSWTATGASADSGKASYYDIRYAEFEIDSANFETTTKVKNAPRPSIAGETENFKITKLQPSTKYYFAIKASDSFYFSKISNVVEATTLQAPAMAVNPENIYQALDVNQTEIRKITIHNSGPGVLKFNFPEYSGVQLSGSLSERGNSSGTTLQPGQFITSITPNNGTVLSEGDIEISLQISSAGLASDNYEKTVVLESNDPLLPLFQLPVILHVNGTPEISYNELDFGNVFVNYAGSKILKVTNTGTDTLEVSQISSDNNSFTLKEENNQFKLYNNESRNIEVIFQPTSVADYSGYLIINNNSQNNPEAKVLMTGKGLNPPIITAMPDSIFADLQSGDTLVQQITIDNTSGGSELVVSISTQTRQSVNIEFSQSQDIQSTTNADSYSYGKTPLRTYYYSSQGVIEKLSAQTDVLILHDDLSNVTEIQGLLQAFPNLNISTLNGDAVIVDSEMLRIYQIIIVSNNGRWNNPVNIGNALADYVDNEGKVIVTVPTFYNDFNLQGRLIDEGYLPVNTANQLGYEVLGSFNYSHPFMQGVNTVFADLIHPDATIKSNSSDIARFSGGGIFVAKNENIAAVNIFLGSPGFWSGDIPTLLYNAINYMSNVKWLVPETKNTTVQAGTSQTMNVKLNAKELNGGIYDAFLNISSNDPVNPVVQVPAHLKVTGIPEIDVNPVALNFGEVFKDYNKTVPVIIKNTGTDLLTIINITSNNPNFTVNSTNFSLKPGEEMKIDVTFNADNVKQYAGILNIINNSANNPNFEISLSGDGVLPPVITVYPDSIYTSLLSADSVIQQLTIGNINGGSKLVTKINVVPKSTVSFSRDKTHDIIRTNLEAEEYSAEKPIDDNQAIVNFSKKFITYYDGFESGSLAEWIIDPGSGTKEIVDTYPAKGKKNFYIKNPNEGHLQGIHQEFENGSQPKYIGAYIKSGSTSLADAYLVFRDQAGFDVIWFFAHASGKLYVNGDVGGDESYVYNANIWYHIEFKDIDWIDKDFDYYVNGALVKADIPFRNSGNVNDISHLYLYNYHASKAWWDEINIGENLSWLTTEKSDLIIGKGLSEEIGVKMNAAGLFSGLYEADLLLNSNDPSNPEIRIPVSMNVTSAPGITTLPKKIDFGQIFTNAVDEKILKIQNIGSDTLLVSGITIDNPNYTVNNSQFELSPGGFASVNVTFSSTTVGNFPANITIVSNDPTQPQYLVPLTAEAIFIPCNTADSLALVAIYNATDGPNWGNKTNWLTGNVQNWYGVTLDMNGRVTDLNLTRNRLNGYLPSAVGDLTELINLHLGNNMFVTQSYGDNRLSQQPLPQTMAKLTSLEILSLDQLWINGELPDMFGGMTKLRELYVQYNYFINQSFPASIASCSNIEKMSIYYNNFYDLPNLLGLAKLSNLQASSCFFAFDDIEPNLSIPGFYYSSQRLILGTPESLNPAPGETVTRTIEVGGANNIYQWYKDGLALDGQTTNTLTLENVDTGDAGIYTLRVTNSIATQLTLTSHPIILFQNQLPIYQALEAFYNSTGGPNWYNKNNWLSNQPITTWYGINVSSSNGLIYLSLYDNNLIGSLPEEFGNLSIFYLIQLSNNPGLTGEIPTSIGQLTNLQYLYLENNKLTGNIPAEIKNCGKLRYFYFNRNEIKNLPPDLTGLDLYGANTSNNKLEFDDIITWIGKVRYGFTYSPQKKYGEVESKPLIIGNSLTFNGLAGGDGNIYQWYQNNEIMPGQTGSELVFETLTAADEGTYECRVTNPAAPNLTLISEPKSLYDASNLDAYEPDNYFVDAQEITGADYQQRSLFPAGDRDIAWFEITQPSQVKIWMSNGSWGSRQLSVYATDTTTVLASGSDYATLFVIEPGIYYAKAWSQNSEVISEYFLDIEITPVTIDQYEPDNTWEEAKQIYPFFPQDDHNLKPFNDVDYVKIQIADAPRLITVDVYNETQCRNFNLWLYDTDGTSELAFSSSGAKNCGARVQYNIPSNGTYYIKTKVPWQEMYDYYTISVTTDGQPPVVKCNAQDSLALVAIYNATNGPNWGNKTNWLTGNVQTWYGVTMNMDGRVTGLNLAANRLNGYVPAEIGNITELKKLILGNSRYVTNYYSSNTLNQQPLPQTLANLTKLEILALDQLWMYNELPDIFSGMTGLRELYINNNYFSNQSLPVGIASCSNLGILYIYNNNFYDLPDLTGLSKLSNLQATGCYFAFDDIEPNLSIPGFYYSSQRLILGTPESINPVTGETVIRTNEVGGANNIYQWYKDGLALDGQTTNTLTLENVDTGDAGIYTLRVTNSIATQLTLTSHPIILYQNQLPIYQALDAFYNSTGGPNWYNKNNWLSNQPITTWYGININSSNGLIYLSLYDNNLIGSLPEEFGDLSIFYLIQIYYNPGLTGEIPESVGQLSNLQSLYIVNNNLTGEIPSSIGQLTNLQSLYLFNNKLSGNVPAEIGNMSQLYYFYIYGNQIEHLPNEITNCNRLRYFLFNNNKISDLPNLAGMDYLYRVHAHNNKLEFDDIIPLIGQFNQFEYASQDSIGESVVYNKTTGEYFSHSLVTGGQGNQYQWYKEGILLDGQTNATITFNTLSTDNSGYYFCTVTNPAAPKLTLYSKVIYLSVLENNLCPQHFHTVWEGTSGVDHMNINVLDAKMDGVDLESGDEIGVFDGDLCVGYGKVFKTIDQQNILTINVSRDEGSGNGFTQGNEIFYKFWDCSTENEIIVNNIQCFNTKGEPVTCLPFESMSSSFVKLSAISDICQTLNFNSGWNITSIPLTPESDDLVAVFQPLISNSSLVKIMNEEGNSLEDWGIYGGWKNFIGKVSPTEGYKVKLSKDDNFEICGTPVKYPFAIPLKSGWNIMGYPQTEAYDALEVLKQLINEGKLVKVQDEGGFSIEDWGIYGGWKNNIGDFVPGKGYNIKLNADASLWINESYPKSTSIQPEFIATTHFKPAFTGNGLDHININLVGLPLNILQIGDELAVFDGTTCVGAVTLTSRNISNQSVSIAASAKDNQGMAGFTEGNPIMLKLWNSKQNTEYTLEPEILKGSAVFTKHETTFASLEKYATTSVEGIAGNGLTEINCYPNPFSDEVTIEIKLVKDSKVHVEVLNQIGQRVKFLQNEKLMNGGVHRLKWDGKSADNQKVSTGIYHLRITVDDTVLIRKMVYSK